MDTVWEKGSASVRDVMTHINSGKRKLAYTTIMTVMQRLKDKGWLAAHKEGRAFIYEPAVRPEEAEAKAVSKVVRELVSDHGDVAIAQFLKEMDEIPPDYLAQLEKLTKHTDDPQSK